ncbi:hypothetical protein PF008_g31095 [Phytophthora fragariae]|uniref:Uncharacterized protein n=1 Tax=Phytophthora fragariae TaxID=53985 RepID=A0A6G0Q462_9STRA|nr:hypothetical protein PF008_g31095 [Phytophthora fragariae]
MERRARLDVVHDRLNLGRMDRDPYDIAILDGVLKAEADKLHALAGTGGGSAHPTGTIVAPDGDSARRNPISAQGKVARSTLERILDAINADPELVSDRAKLRHLKEENLSAIKVWLRRGHTQPRQPQFHGGTDDFLPLMTWLVMHRTALHDLLQFVPYPELIAKFLPREMLLRWGDLELCDLQIATMRQLVNHEEVPIPAKEYCRSWVAACTTEDGSTRDRQLAKDPQRWLRLRGLYTAAPMCSCPPGVTEDCWRVLHTLPHVVWAWSVTPWGTYPRTQLGSIYQVHPAVQQAC